MSIRKNNTIISKSVMEILLYEEWKGLNIQVQWN